MSEQRDAFLPNKAATLSLIFDLNRVCKASFLSVYLPTLHAGNLHLILKDFVKSQISVEQTHFYFSSTLPGIRLFHKKKNLLHNYVNVKILNQFSF